MHVLAIEPYYGGSHQAFLDGLVSRSRHRWSSATLPARHWKWRMRSSPVAMAEAIVSAVRRHGRPDVILASDMFDLPTWLGMASRDGRFSDWLFGVPLVTYFHENQWAYPSAPGTPVDHHYGYTNLLTAAASNVCWFNSLFNRSSFLDLSRQFVNRMPDARRAIDLERIEQSSRVLAPGFRPPEIRSSKRKQGSAIRLGWVGRFEHDKRPDKFLELLDRLTKNGLRFELILLGQRGRACETLDQIRAGHGSAIRFDGYAKTRDAYEAQLREMDVVVSTADHEFFGIAICEAIWAGAIPVTPNGLSYVEYVPQSLRYDSTQQAASILSSLNRAAECDVLVDDCRSRIARYRIDEAVKAIDAELDTLTR